MAGIWFGGLILFAFYEGHSSHDGPRLSVPEPPRPTVIALKPGEPESPSYLNKLWGSIRLPKQETPAILPKQETPAPLPVYAYVNNSLEPTASPDAPGELGRPVVVEKSKLSAGEQKEFQAGWDHNSFNEYISKMISVRRRLADFRDEEYVILLSELFLI